MTYVEFDEPIVKELESKLSGRQKFELVGAYYDNGKAKKFIVRSVKNGIEVYDEFTDIEVAV